MHSCIPHESDCVTKGIELLKKAGIYYENMKNDLMNCKGLAHKMATEMIRLHENQLLQKEHINALKNHQGILKNLTDAIIALNQAQILNTDNLALVCADNTIPDKKAAALIILSQHHLLNEQYRQALLSTHKIPETFSKILILLKPNDETLKRISEYRGQLTALLKGLELLCEKEIEPRYQLELLNDPTHPENLAGAFVWLQRAQIKIDDYLDSLRTHNNLLELARCMASLHEEKILNENHFKLLVSSIDLTDTYRKILEPHMLKKARARGFLLGLYTGSASGILMWGFAPRLFQDITIMLGFSHPAVTLVILALTCALMLSLTFYLTQNNIHQSLKTSNFA